MWAPFLANTTDWLRSSQTTLSKGDQVTSVLVLAGLVRISHDWNWPPHGDLSHRRTPEASLYSACAPCRLLPVGGLWDLLHHRSFPAVQSEPAEQLSTDVQQLLNELAHADFQSKCTTTIWLQPLPVVDALLNSPDKREYMTEAKACSDTGFWLQCERSPLVVLFGLEYFVFMLFHPEDLFLFRFPG